MGGLGLLTVIVAGYLFLRPARRVGRLGAQDAARIHELLAKYGERDSLGYFTLRTDKSIIWSPTGKSCIGYRVQSGVMLASGDPIGDPEAWPGAISAFLDEAARHAWVPAVLGCSELGAETWCREGDGLTALELGDEAIVSVADFTLQGRSMRNVRQMVTRVCKHGYVAEVRRVGDVPRAEIDRMNRQADSWRGNPTERGFSMALGRVGGVGDEDCVIATATEDGVLRAILHFVPWGPDGLSLDLMRRDRAAQPGLNDFLIVEVIKARARSRREAHLAELRHVPRGSGARRADRRRAGAAGLARTAAGRLAVVPDRVAVQVQREVLPGVGAAVRRLHRHQGHPEDRPGRARGGGLRRLAHGRGAQDRAAGRAQARPRQGQAPPARRSPAVAGRLRRTGRRPRTPPAARRLTTMTVRRAR